jgi:transposase
MARTFIQVNYDTAINITVRLGDCVSPDHLARFIVDVIALLDLTAIYARYGPRGAPAYAPELLLGLLFYGYATGVFSTRQIEQATYESLPFRFIAGDRHPDHDTLAHFRKTFLPEITTLFAQVLLIAYEAGVLKLGAMSLDGTKIHADASKSKAVSDNRLIEIEAHLRKEVEDLMALGGRAEQGEALPEGLVISEEIVRRQERRTSLAEAKAVIEARAEARDRADHVAYEAKLREREEKARTTGHKPRGRPPSPPTPGARDNDQYNCTDPESQIMKNSTNQGFDQHDNAQIATAQDSLLIVGHALSNHANDQAEVEPTFDAIPPAVGTPPAAALDNGYFSEANIERFEARGIEPYIATGRDAHYQSWRERFVQTPVPPLDDASPKVKMAYKLQTEIGKAIYRLRKCTVEPVFGIIKETLGFRQFSLRGLKAAAGEWGLVCLAFNLKRLHTLTNGQSCSLMISPTGC